MVLKTKTNNFINSYTLLIYTTDTDKELNILKIFKINKKKVGIDNFISEKLL